MLEWWDKIKKFVYFNWSNFFKKKFFFVYLSIKIFNFSEIFVVHSFKFGNFIVVIVLRIVASFVLLSLVVIIVSLIFCTLTSAFRFFGNYYFYRFLLWFRNMFCKFYGLVTFSGRLFCSQTLRIFFFMMCMPWGSALQIHMVELFYLLCKLFHTFTFVTLTFPLLFW